MTYAFLYLKIWMNLLCLKFQGYDNLSPHFNQSSLFSHTMKIVKEWIFCQIAYSAQCTGNVR